MLNSQVIAILGILSLCCLLSLVLFIVHIKKVNKKYKSISPKEFAFFPQITTIVLLLFFILLDSLLFNIVLNRPSWAQFNKEIYIGFESLLLLAGVYIVVRLRCLFRDYTVHPRKEIEIPRVKLKNTIAKLGIGSTWIAAIVGILSLSVGLNEPLSIKAVWFIGIAVLAYSTMMQTMPWRIVSSQFVFKVWTIYSTIMIALIIPFTGGADSKAYILFFLVFVLAGATFTVSQMLVISTSISLVYCLEVLLPIPIHEWHSLFPHLGLVIPLFIVVSWASTRIIKEARDQSIKRSTYEKLVANLEVKISHLNALDEISKASSSSDLQQLFQKTIQVICKVFHSDIGYLMLWDNHTKTLNMVAEHGYIKESELSIVQDGLGITATAATRKSIVTFSEKDFEVVPDRGSKPKMIKSGIAAPMIASGSLVGVITIYSKQELTFSEDERTLLGLICERMAGMVVTARLYAEKERSATESYILYETARTITSLGSVQEVLDYSTSRLVEITGTEKCVAATLDKNSGLLRVSASYGESGSDLWDYRLDIHAGLGEYIMNNKKALAVNNAEQYSAADQETVLFFNVKSFMMVPIVSRNETYGTFYAYNSDQAMHFSKKALDMAEAFSSLVSISLDNLLLLESLNQQVNNLKALNLISARINSQLNLQGTLDLIVSEAARVLKKTGVVLALFNEENFLTARSTFGMSERFKANFHISPSDGLARLIFEDGEPHYSCNYGNDVVNPNDDVIIEQLSFIMGVPLKNPAGQIFGVLYTGDPNSYHPGKEEIELATLFATQASIAIINSTLYEDLEKRLEIMAHLYDITTGLGSPSETRSFPEFLPEKVASILGAEFCAFFQYHEQNEMLFMSHPVYVFDQTEWWTEGKELRLSIEYGIGFETYFNQEPILLPGGFRDSDAIPGFRMDLVRDGLCVRVGTTPKMSGVLFVLNKIRGTFNEDDRRMLSVIVNPVNVFLDNAQLLTDVKTRVQNLTDLMDVANALQGSLREEEILDTIVKRVSSRFQAFSCQISLINPQVGYLEVAAHCGLSMVTSDSYEAAGCMALYGSNCPVLTNDDAYIFLRNRQSCPFFNAGSPVRSYMCAPLRSNNQTLGMLHITSLEENAFVQEDLSLLSSFAVDASLAVQRGHLFSALADENAKIETIIHSMEDPLAVLDRSSKLSMVNDAFFRYLAVKQDVIGMSLPEAVNSSPYRIEFETNLGELIHQTLNEGRRHTITCSISDISESHFTHVTFVPIIDQRFNITGAIVLFHDVTELQTLLEQLEQEKIKAEEANRLKSEFLANMSHELRTPLNSIIGYSQCVVDGLDGPVNLEQVKDLNRVISSAESLLHLINDVLDLSKIEAGKMEIVSERVEVPSLIRDVLTSLLPTSEQKGVELREDIESKLPVLNTDSFRIRQVLINLVSNAMKFTDQGMVTVGAYYNTDLNSVVFYVQDTGIGIDEQSLDYIFDEFRQADGSTTRRYGGSGLGLSISRKLVELMGGDIWVESKVNVGSCFHFSIPVKKAQPIELTFAQIAASQFQEPNNNQIVVAIDDDIDVLTLIKKYLEPEGYQVVEALSGLDGIRLIKKLQPFAVTLDIMMPEFDGWETLYKIKCDDEIKNTPVIVISIIRNPELGFALGATEYLTKPFQRDDLIQKIGLLKKPHADTTVLVVDDDPDFCEIVEKMLGAEFNTLKAQSGEEALGILNFFLPDIILVDLMMPEMDGFQLITHVRSQFSVNIPLIV
ncbi:MAG: GAF domain-containing protein, partial [Chitinophagales bacterium]